VGFGGGGGNVKTSDKYEILNIARHGAIMQNFNENNSLFPEDLEINNRMLALLQVVDGSFIAGVYLDALLDWAYEKQSNILFKGYGYIRLITMLDRKQQDSAIRILNQKSWFDCSPESRFGCPGLVFKLDISVIKAEFDRHLAMLESK
jgi:hypothetical protein